MSVKIYMDTLTLFIFYKSSLKWVDKDIPTKHEAIFHINDTEVSPKLYESI